LRHEGKYHLRPPASLKNDILSIEKFPADGRPEAAIKMITAVPHLIPYSLLQSSRVK
jgi:hypothetical protein